MEVTSRRSKMRRILKSQRIKMKIKMVISLGALTNKNNLKRACVKSKMVYPPKRNGLELQEMLMERLQKNALIDTKNFALNQKPIEIIYNIF